MTLAPPDGDRFLARLAEVGEGLDVHEREAFLARLVLLLADRVGDGEAVLAAAEEAARARGPATR